MTKEQKERELDSAILFAVTKSRSSFTPPSPSLSPSPSLPLSLIGKYFDEISLDTGNEMEVVERMPLIEWLANNYKSFGTALEIITDKSQEGSQFCRGFGGIGGVYNIYL